MPETTAVRAARMGDRVVAEAAEFCHAAPGVEYRPDDLWPVANPAAHARRCVLWFMIGNRSPRLAAAGLVADPAAGTVRAAGT